MKRHVTLDYIRSCRSHRYSTDWQTGATDFPNIPSSFPFSVCNSFPYLSIFVIFSLQRPVHSSVRHLKSCTLHLPPTSFLSPSLLYHQASAPSLHSVITFPVLLTSLFSISFTSCQPIMCGPIP